MKQYIKGILTLIALLMVLLGTIWLGRPNRHKGTLHFSKSITAPVIETTYPVRRNFFSRLNWFGRVESKRTVKIISLVAGKITAVKVVDGAFVRRGSLLFTIGGPQVKHKLYILTQRVSALEKQKSFVKNLVQIKHDAVAEKLAKREELLSAKEHLAQIEADLLATKEKLDAFRAALFIHAPMDGIFVNRKVSLGQDIKEGEHLADIISMDLRITAWLFPPADVKLLGKRAVIRTPSGTKITGTVTRVLPQPTAEGAIEMWIENKKIKNILRPGEPVSGWIVLEIRKNVLAVPQDAVMRDEQGHTFVFVKTAHGYKKKAVKIGLEDAGWCEIVSGLSKSDEVVVQGAYELFYRDFTKTYKETD